MIQRIILTILLCYRMNIWLRAAHELLVSIKKTCNWVPPRTQHPYTVSNAAQYASSIQCLVRYKNHQHLFQELSSKYQKA